MQHEFIHFRIHSDYPVQALILETSALQIPRYPVNIPEVVKAE